MKCIVPYTPEQNGVAERRNHKLKETTNCMIQSKGLSLKYWAEAINCANYIVNHTPTKFLKNITLEEAWTKIKPDVSHFREFGSIAWAHIPDEKRKVLQPKSEKCIFVSYLKMSKVIYFFNHIVMKLLLEEMLNLMKICWSESLIRRLCLLRLASNLRRLCLLLFLF
jgi:hypothetical protein